MSFYSDASKLLTNKYFLYFIVFLAVTNVLGYLVTQKLNAVIFFALVSLLSYQFSKNMAVVLLIALIATNFMMSSKIIREGLENASSPALEKASERDTDIKDAADAVQSSKDNAEAKEKYQKKTTAATSSSMPETGDGNVATNAVSSETVSDPNNTDLNQAVEEAGAPEGFGEKMSSKKGHSSGNAAPRIDYATTIQQSYGQLDEILGGDAIKQLTKDTQNLMSQQQNLFNTMNQMVPVLEGAQNMLKGFDIGGLANSLGSFKDLGSKMEKKPSK